MNALEELLWSFDQSDLEEITLAANRTAEGVTNGVVAPLGDDVWTNDALVDALVSFGGSRHVEELSMTPRQWTARVVGLGVIAVSATQKGIDVEARFRVSKRAGKSAPPPPPDPRIVVGGKGAAAQRNFTPTRPMQAVEAPKPIPPGPLPKPPPPPEPPKPPAQAETTRLRKPAGLKDLSLDEAPGAPTLDLDAGPAKPRAPAVSPATLSLPPLPLPPAAARQPPPAPVMLDLPPVPVAPAPAPAPPPPVFTTLLANARDARASDLHIIAGRPPLYRVGGELRATGPVMSPEYVEKMVLPLVPARLAPVLEAQGSCDFAIDDATHGRFRVNVSRQQTGYKACLRLVSRELPTVDSLRLPEGIATASHHHQGLIVFTGPTGHGKTTTMNAVVDLINRTTSHHIITVEDPVEHLHPKKSALMSQREVGTHTASFAAALKASLREDPDVIVVGELRDVETVRMAVSASETGHLVLGTMNTPSAARTLDRLIDLFPPADQPQIRLTLAAGLRLIVSQRLVPAKEGGGMHAAFEVLPGSVPLSALIRDNKTFQIPSLQQRGKALGIVRLDDSLAKLVAEDRVSLEVAKAMAEAPQELEAGIKAFKAAPR
jgi:twitching motility protein PilT